MTQEQFLKNLQVPTSQVDVVLDTDAYNEVDDRYALAYLLRSKEKLNTKAIYAAPYLHTRVETPEEGMENSYREILKLLDLLGESVPVFKGSRTYLNNDCYFPERLYEEVNRDYSEYKGATPPASKEDFVESEAARDLVARAKNYSPENPLYVVAIGAITNIASAILMDKSIAENIVVVWLGGKSRHQMDAKEYNLVQDYTAARTVMESGVPFVQVPCLGVTTHFKISKIEFEHWLLGTTPIADYLVRETVDPIQDWAKSDFWSTTIHDVVAVAWLLNDDQRFMWYRVENMRLPQDTGFYGEELPDKKMSYVFYVDRDSLMKDLFGKLAEREF